MLEFIETTDHMLTVKDNDGRTIHIIDSLGREDHNLAIWLHQLSPVFVFDVCDSRTGLDTMIEEAVDALDVDLSADMDWHEERVAEEAAERGVDLSECCGIIDNPKAEEALEAGDDGFTAINGGGEWISDDQWGVTTLSDETVAECIELWQRHETFAESMSVCNDCAMMIANGEAPHDATEEEAAWLAESTAGLCLVHDVHGESGKGFSHARCDACNSKLAGDRYAAVEL